MSFSPEQRIRRAQELLSIMKDKIRTLKHEKNDKRWSDVTASLKDLPPLTFKSPRHLVGHTNKIYAVAVPKETGSDKLLVASASQDGRMILWNGQTGSKLIVYQLDSSWVMSCGMSPNARSVASGGLDNTVTVYPISLSSAATVEGGGTKLYGHTGYITAIKYLGPTSLLSSSGDTRCMTWDVSTGQAVSQFADHSGDVMSLSVAPDGATFLSGSTDTTLKLWDIRTSKAVMTFSGHTGDVNGVEYFPNGLAFGSASEDGTCRYWDVRAGRDLATFTLASSKKKAFSSVAFSTSGRVMFGGSDDYTAYAFDVFKGRIAGKLQGHQSNVSCMAVSGDGSGIVTGSWDSLVRIWVSV